jgi:hypothetical protein
MVCRAPHSTSKLARKTLLAPSCFCRRDPFQGQAELVLEDEVML